MPADLLVALFSFLALSFLLGYAWHLKAAPRLGVTPHEWEESVLLYVAGGDPHGPAPDAREVGDRVLDLKALAEAVATAKGWRVPEVLTEFEDAFTRLRARGAAAHHPPPPGSDAAAKPPEHLVLLTPRGAREALEVRARVLKGMVR